MNIANFTEPKIDLSKPKARILDNGDVLISYLDYEVTVPESSIKDNSCRMLFVLQTGVPLPREGIEVQDDFFSNINEVKRPKCIFEPEDSPEQLLAQAIMQIHEQHIIPDLKQLALALSDRISDKVMDHLEYIIREEPKTTTDSVLGELLITIGILQDESK